MISKLRKFIMALVFFLERTAPRPLRYLDLWLYDLEEWIRRWRIRRFERHLRPQPRVWTLVGGKSICRPEEVIRRYFPTAYEMRHDQFVTRWFVGRKPVAEVVPDPSGIGRRVFFNEKLSPTYRQA